ncbi:hypothetical protein FRC02_008010 [Tulasnella sp. 418]|nr:hypothetical protein FRC02_008010 [Tulasnella sp. 418]
MEKLGAISCSLTGMVIEAFSVLACATRDDTWRRIAIEIATTAMKYTEWHGPDGTLLVDKAGHSDMKEYTGIVCMLLNRVSQGFMHVRPLGLLHRGLLIAYERNPNDHAFRDQVRSYINVQFNALYQLSGYRVMRRGEGERRLVVLQPDAQMAALDTLVAAIGVNL